MLKKLQRRVHRITDHVAPTIDPSFFAFAREVIQFGGHEPTPNAVELLAHWYAGGYRRQFSLE